MTSPLHRFPVRTWRAVILGGLGVHLTLAALGPDVIPSIWVQRLMMVLVLVCAAGALVRALTERRALWIALAAAIGLWAIADSYYTLFIAGSAEQEFPSPADALWLTSYVPLFAAVMLVARTTVAGWDTGLWLDGLIAALGTAALGAVVVLPSVDTGTAQGLELLVVLAYPILDVLLLGAAAGGWVLTGGGPGRTWRRLATGLVVLAVADIAFLLQVAAGTYHSGVMTDAGWILAFFLLAGIGWSGGDLQPRRRLRSQRVPLVPIVGSAGGVVLLAVDHYVSLNATGVWLALLMLTLGLARTALAFHHNVRLQDTAHQAVTDELTGLGNRRRLLGDLKRELRAGGRPSTLVLFDLDGFKVYNDSYGHPAGDALLTALGQRLRGAAAEHACAYRLGGDEFCLLVTTGAVDHDLVLQQALGALQQTGPGFAITASYGAVALPAEAAEPVEALQLADTRMYAQKDARRASTRRQSRDLLLQILHEQQPDLEEHSADVGGLVVAVGRRLGLDGASVEHARHAAELHDVGKVAIPEAILRKPAALDDDEWALMKRHTVIGERILSAVPALVPVARIVRSTHERWDGGGYPDGLRGTDVPLEARIVAVCDSFHAITTDRPYRKGRTVAEAIEELRRCAGTQFDPDVVEAFAAELLTGGDPTSEPEHTGAVAHGVERALVPAGTVASAAAGELATLVQLRGMLHAKQLARGGADVAEVLDAISATIASSLGFRTVAVNLYRPEWDDVVCTTVVGSDGVREALLGGAEPAQSWRPLLDPRFALGSAYFVPAGSVDWDTFGLTHVPDIAPSEDPGAWQSDDALFVPLHATTGELLGIVSVDEPIWGRRPLESDLEVLAAVCDHAALAIELAGVEEQRRRWSRAEARAGVLASELSAPRTSDEIAGLTTGAVREGLRFDEVALEPVDDESSARVAEALLAEGEDRRGAVLLSGRAAASARDWRGAGGSRRNGRGPQAWRDHLLAAPLRGPSGELLAVLWADDPLDRRLPGDEAATILCRMAGHATVALAAARRDTADASLV